MNEIEEIIEFENENTSLDFKAKQYVKENYESFLKDVISMANGKSNDRKLIIIGIKHKPNGKKEILGIGDEFVDDATYQQLIQENIEPEIKLSYIPFVYKNKRVGIFELFNCSDKPYMMKKDFKNLRRGDSFIRKGSHQTRVTRKDIDYFIQDKIEEKSFKGEVDINFVENGKKELELKPILELSFPSDEAEEKIKKILKEKEEKFSNKTDFPIPILDQDIPMIGGTPYENRSTATLKENLKNVKKTYEEDDLNYLFEEKSHRLNFTLKNNGEEYIEDASIKVIIQKNESILIADKIYEKPDNRSWVMRINEVPTGPSWLSMHYPEVKETEEEYIIFENVGNLKHLIAIEAFEVPIRFCINANGIGKELKIKILLFGKNLQKPISEELILKIVK